MRSKTALELLPDFLLPAHRIMQRYVAATGVHDLRRDEWRELKATLPSGLDPQAAEAVDAIYLRAPEPIRAVLKGCYMQLGSPAELALRAGLTLAVLQMGWIEALVWLRCELRASRNPAITRILDTPIRLPSKPGKTA